MPKKIFDKGEKSNIKKKKEGEFRYNTEVEQEEQKLDPFPPEKIRS